MWKEKKQSCKYLADGAKSVESRTSQQSAIENQKKTADVGKIKQKQEKSVGEAQW